LQNFFLNYNCTCIYNSVSFDATMCNLNYAMNEAMDLAILYGLINIPGGHAVAHLVEALCYELEGRGFDSRWCHWNFSLHNPFGRTMTLGLTQPLTEMRTRNISWG